MLNKKNKIYIGVVILVAACLVTGGIIAYIEYTKTDDENKVTELTKKLDNRISPDINQGITVEVLRIRNRGLLDKMTKVGNSWKNTPSFYWVIDVDGEVCDSLGEVGTGSSGTFNMWDNMGLETRVNYYTSEEQETSHVSISIVEQVKSFLKTRSVEKEKIDLIYDFYSGRWTGDDKFMDDDGYGHYLGQNYEVWFNVYQADLDHDAIPYWVEVNVLGTDPTVDDRELDPDNDGIPTSWEWKWGYDPMVADDHKNLDPDVDGIENIEEYQMRKYFADPYQPDIYIEADGMESNGLIDSEHIFFPESQQMIIERFAQHGINFYIDDGWDDGPVNGGGEKIPFIDAFDQTQGQILAFYTHNFADERKGIFRYLIVGNKYGYNIPSEYNYYDTILVGNGFPNPSLKRYVFSSRMMRVTVAKGVLHEMGHSLGLMPWTFAGVDIMDPVGSRYPSMPDDEYEKYLEQYHSIMNYNYIWRDRNLVDYSDGANGQPYDQNDWDYLYLPTFQIDSFAYEEPIDETFEDFELVDDYQGVQLEGWVYDQDLTNEYLDELSNMAHVKNADSMFRVYVNTEKTSEEDAYAVRVYTMPDVNPTWAVWSLFAQGHLENGKDIQFYSLQGEIDQVMQQFAEMEN